MPNLSVIIIAKNAQDLITDCIESIQNITDEVIVVDNGSSDNTTTIAKSFHAKIYTNLDNDLGKLKNFALSKATSDWILSLDTDETVTPELAEEIMKVTKNRSKYKVYSIPFQNHFLGKPLHYGGENYKMIRLFQKNAIEIAPALVHEGFTARKGARLGYLANKINHYSYRSLVQMYRKFTDYALREARQKRQAGETTSFKKIFMYAPHMFWARFIKDKGYKDGLFRLPLDIGFAYMELLTYTSILFV